jgi:hypothetical protein
LFSERQQLFPETKLSKASASTYQVSALAVTPLCKGDKSIMTDKECLKPWAVVRLLPNLQWAIIGRYRNRADADGHLLLCRQQVPNIQWKVVFALPNRTDLIPQSR